MEKRFFFLDQISRYFQSHPVVAILGPRQCGKTTLARTFSKQQLEFPKSNYFDLENLVDLERLANPMLTLKPLSGLVVIDEIQRLPDLFPPLRVLVDEEGSDRRFLILGSASRELIRQSCESLAGRIAYLELTPFSFTEVDDLQRLWLCGGFPRSYLAKNEEESVDWRNFYIRTFLEQDIPNLGIKIPQESLRRFWMMLAHYHGNLFNASELGRSFGATDMTMKKYLEVLTGTFMIRQLKPWHENISKRQVKTSKIYFRDSGIFHSLLSIHTKEELLSHPKLGASWEGFALEEVIRKTRSPSHDCYFWSTHGEAEVDLLIHEKGRLTGYEFKYQDAPSLTKSMKIAIADLNLRHLFVIYPGETDYLLSEHVSVHTLKNFLQSK